MKKTILYISFILVTIIGFTSCEEKWDTPTLETPEATFKRTRTIRQVKRIYDNDLTQTKNPDPDSILLNNGDYIIEAWVTSSDETRNFYKSIFIQDSTGGIELLLDKENLHLELPVGQKLLIRCNNLIVGKPSNGYQIGWKEGNQMAPIHHLSMWKYIQKSGLPDVSKMPSPTPILTAADLASNIGKLVEIENCRFSANDIGEILGSKKHTIYFNENDSLYLDISPNAKFNDRSLYCSEREGKAIGILTSYGSAYSLKIRSAKDIEFLEYPIF